LEGSKLGTTVNKPDIMVEKEETSKRWWMMGV